MADPLLRFGSGRPTVTRRRGARGRSPARGRFGASIAALAILLAACGGGSTASPTVQAQATPSPSASPTAEATPTPVTPTPEVTPTPAVTPTATAAAAACQSHPPTALSQGWKQLTAQDGDYRFSYPADWADLSGTVPLTAKDSVSPTTFAETGLGSDAKINIDFVKTADGSLGISAWELKGVRSGTSALFDSDLAWLKTQPQLKSVLDDRLEVCIDGSTARGFSSSWTASPKDNFLIIYVLQRNGKMYEVQMTAQDPASAATLQELLQTWKWSEPLAGTPNNIDAELAATKFMAIGTSSTLDQSGNHPNAATFSSTFPTTVDRIYAIYELDDGVHETVLFSWKRNGVQVAKASFDYSDKTSYAWTWMNGPFKAGDYDVTATLKTSGDTIMVSSGRGRGRQDRLVALAVLAAFAGRSSFTTTPGRRYCSGRPAASSAE